MSNFFGTLPPSSSSADLVDGTAVLPLNRATSGGLTLFLSLAQSITTLHFLNPTYYDDASIINAAILAKQFDTPIVYRLLSDYLRPAGRRDNFMVFAVWAISGSARRTKEAAEATLGSDLSKADPCIPQALAGERSGAWTSLQDLHIRHAIAMRRFREFPDWGKRAGIRGRHTELCPACGMDKEDLLEGVEKRYSACQSAEELEKELLAGDMGVQCRACRPVAFRYFYPRVTWTRAFSSRYEFRGTEREYYDQAQEEDERIDAGEYDDCI